MNENQDDRLRCLQLEAFGRLMAGFSHELKNHLAIIKESIGLLDDKLSMGSVTDDATAEKFKRIVTAIEKRVTLAAEMSQHLSSFSHRLDTPFSLFHVNEMVNEELAFLYRFARLRNIAVETELGDDLPAIYNNPSLFQFVFFEIFNYALSRFNKSGRIVVLSGKQDGNIRVALRLIDTADEAGLKGSTISENVQFAATKMRAKIDLLRNNTGYDEILLLIKIEPEKKPAHS